jgi:hypothetical protein
MQGLSCSNYGNYYKAYIITSCRYISLRSCSALQCKTFVHRSAVHCDRPTHLIVPNGKCKLIVADGHRNKKAINGKHELA